MAFPLTPNVGDRHTEAGLRFVWTGNSWDHSDSTKGQEIYFSTTAPTSANSAPYGSIWRNTLTGEAYRAEENRAPAGAPVVTDYLSAPPANSQPLSRARQSFTTPAGGHKLSDVSLTLFFPSTSVSLDITADLYAGEDTVTAPQNVPSLGPILDTVTESFSNPTPGSSGFSTVSFTFLNSPVLSGQYTVVFTVSNVVGSQAMFSYHSTGYSLGQLGITPSYDLCFKTTEIPFSGLEWNKVQARQDVITSVATPTNKDDGTALIDGDFWLEAANGEWYFRAGGQWVPTRAYYDKSIVNVLNSSDTQSAIEEIDSILDILSGGLGFIGTYAPNSNTVDFTVSSGYPDGILPSANTLTPADFLVVTEQGIGQAPAPVVQMYKGDYLIADPPNNTWIHLPIGNPLASFIDLPDTPASYSLEQGKVLVVNASETAIEFVQGGDVNSFYSFSAPTPVANGDQWMESGTQREKVAPTSGVNLWLEQVYVQQSAGTPPSTPYSGQLWYDNTSNILYIYDVSTTPASWVSL